MISCPSCTIRTPLSCRRFLTFFYCDGCDTHHMDYCQERCYGRSWHGYLLAHTRSFLFPSSSSFLSFSIAQIRGQIPVSLRSSVPYHRDRDSTSLIMILSSQPLTQGSLFTFSS